MIPSYLQGKSAAEIVGKQREQFMRRSYNCNDDRVRDRILQLEAFLLLAVKDALCNVDFANLIDGSAAPAWRAIEFLNTILSFNDQKPTSLSPSMPSFPRFVNPEWETVQQGISTDILCSCGQMLRMHHDVREHWQRGHFGKWEE